MDLKFEHFDYKKNLAKQRELFADAFPEVQDKTIETYNWQFRQFPNEMNSSFEFCSYIGDDLVGYYAAVPYRYKIMDSLCNVGMVCGVMTSSRYRQQGIFKKLGMYSTNELSKVVAFTTAFPIRKYTIPGHTKIGWKIAFELPLYMNFIKSDSLLQSKNMTFLSIFINPFLSLYSHIFTTKPLISYEIANYSQISYVEGYEEFARKWASTIPNALIKDLAFTNWRYGRPGQKYNFVVVKHDGQIVGFTSYCAIIKENVPSYCLLDLMVLPGYFDCTGILFKNLRIKAKNEGVEAIMFMMSKHSAKQYKVISNGFLRSPFDFYLIIKNLTDQFKDELLFKEENWHLMWVDSDDL